MELTKENLKSLMMGYRKSGEPFKVEVIGSILGDIEKQETSGKTRKDLNALEIEGVFRKGIKTRKETSEIYREAGETSRSEKEQAEADFLETFVPELLDEAETRALVENLIKEKGLEGSGPRGIGQVMKELKEMGNVDSKVASSIAKEILT